MRVRDFTISSFVPLQTRLSLQYKYKVQNMVITNILPTNLAVEKVKREEKSFFFLVVHPDNQTT